MLKRLHKLRDEIHRWTTQPGAELTRKQRAVRYWFDLGRHCFAELKYDKAGQMAAALTYHTLFSLLPTFVLMLVVLQAFVGPEKQEEIKQFAVDWLLKPIAQEVEEVSNPTTTGGEGELIEGRPDTDREQVIAAAERKQEFNEARKAIEDQIQSVMDSLSKVSFGGIGIIGVLIFIYGATGLLTTIEKSFNHIYNAPRMRPIYLRFPLYFTVIVLGPMVVLAGQVGQQKFISLLNEGGTLVDWLAGPMVVISPLVTLLIVIGAVFKWMPNTRVEFRASLIGAIVTAILWLGAIEGLKFFVANSATSSVYGALFLLPLFLLWLWVTWVIILFGLEVAYAVQAMKGRRFKHLAANRDEMVIDPTWLLPLIAEIAARFDQGEPATTEKLADRMNVSRRVTQHMLNTLEAEHMVHRVGGDDDKAAGYVLAKPADRFNAADVLAVGDKMASDIQKRDTPAWNLVGQLRDQWRQAAESTKIEDLARGSSRQE
jgi:membrane protein